MFHTQRSHSVTNTWGETVGDQHAARRRAPRMGPSAVRPSAADEEPNTDGRPRSLRRQAVFRLCSHASLEKNGRGASKRALKNQQQETRLYKNYLL